MLPVEEKPDVTYKNIGGRKEQIEQITDDFELQMLHPEASEQLGIDPRKRVLLYVPPNTGKTLTALIVANGTDSEFIRIHWQRVLQKRITDSSKMFSTCLTWRRGRRAATSSLW